MCRALTECSFQVGLCGDHGGTQGAEFLFQGLALGSASLLGFQVWRAVHWLSAGWESVSPQWLLQR